MLLIKCRKRSRKARRRPQTFVASSFFNTSGSRPTTPTRAMSQTRSVETAMSPATDAVTMPSPPATYHSYYQPFGTPNANNSQAPLLLVGGLNRSRSAVSLGRRSSLSDAEASSSAHNPLPSPYDRSAWAGAGTGGSMGLATAAIHNNDASSSSSRSPGTHSDLHSAMTSHQKALEAEHNAPGHVEPPPQYND